MQQPGAGSLAAVDTAHLFEWLYQKAQQRLLATGGLAPVTRDAGAVAGYWAQFGIGDPVRPTVFAYAWPAAASNALRLGLPGIARRRIADPASLPAALTALGQQLTAGLAQSATGV